MEDQPELCAAPDCKNEAVAQNPPRCHFHLSWIPERKGDDMTETCNVPGCEKPAAKPARGLCWGHYGKPHVREKYANASKNPHSGGRGKGGKADKKAASKKRVAAARKKYGLPPALKKKQPKRTKPKKRPGIVVSVDIDGMAEAIMSQLEAIIKTEVARRVGAIVEQVQNGLAKRAG